MLNRLELFCRCCGGAKHTNRRRVAGKAGPGATTVKSSGGSSDYHLVAPDHKPPEAALPPPPEEAAEPPGPVGPGPGQPQQQHVMPDIAHPYGDPASAAVGPGDARTLPLRTAGRNGAGPPQPPVRDFRVHTDCPDSPIHQYPTLQHPHPHHGYHPPPSDPHYQGMPPHPHHPQALTLPRQGYIHQPACHVGASADLTYSTLDPHSGFPHPDGEPTYMNIQTYAHSPGEHHPSRRIGDSHVGGDWMVHTKI